MAIHCNNVVECAGGIDEKGCDENKIVLYVGLALGFVVSLVLSGIGTWLTMSKEKKSSLSPLVPGSEEHKLKRILSNQSKCMDERKRLNIEEFGENFCRIDTNPTEAYNKVKVAMKLIGLF